MAILDDLIQKVEDPALRRRLEEEVRKATKHKKFGLVFEEHLPECTPLYDLPIKRGSRVAPRDTEIKETFRVKTIDGDKALCVSDNDKSECTFDLGEIMLIAEFGEPIYPYLQTIDTVCNAPDSDLWHTLIEADNYHALQLLEYMYAGQVDFIYIDPPYNLGEDFAYNDNYVGKEDQFRHSKWLSFMQRRLKIAQKLLSPKGVILISINENEYARLKLLCDSVFSEVNYQATFIWKNRQHADSRNKNMISIDHEYILVYSKTNAFTFIGEEKDISKYSNPDNDPRGPWASIDLSGLADATRRPNLHYNIINPETGIEYPPNPNRGWSKSRETVDRMIKENRILWPASPKGRPREKKFLRDLRSEKTGFSSVLNPEDVGYTTDGTKALNSIFEGKAFNFPKSINLIKTLIAQFPKKDCLVLDFFAGSGTTLHAVNLLNAEDGGNRRCMMVTNNEIGERTAKELRKKGFYPGDENWEHAGIARSVTWPRISCSIKGIDVKGNPIIGKLPGTNRAMADGFKTNAIYFKLGFLDKNAVALGRQFKELLSIMWMKAGAVGPCPHLAKNATIPDMMILPENKMAILVNDVVFADFEAEVQKHPEIKTVFIVTDSDRGYREMAASLDVEHTYQLYRDYLDNFKINHRR